MNPKILLSLKKPFTVFFLILSLVEETLASASTPGIEDCEPRNCGGVSISYPFWLGGQQPSYCGPPSFSLTCSDDNHTQTPVLKVLDQSYYIKNISYDDQSVQLTAAVFVNDPCPLPRFNLTVDIYPFSPSPANKKIFFLYNCSISMDPSVYQNISCAPHRTPAYFGGEYDGPGQLNSANSSCQLVVVPVLEHSEAGMKGNYAELLRTGWLLNWTATNCSECRESGGRCGYDESEARFACFCRDRIHLSSCSDGSNNSSDNSTKLIGIVSSLAGLLVCLCLFFFVFLVRRKVSHTKNVKSVEAILRLKGSLSPKCYKYSEIKRMTKSFSCKLGQGGFGTVYKGTLRDGHPVAVKVLISESKGNGEDFINEGSKRALVYEFMPNGSLEKFINNPEQTEAAGTRLGWEKLYEIAVGIARGLEYLHRGCNTRIVHFDIKPHNILLDQDFCPKISDFGLAKLCSPKESAFSTSVAPRGTVGYIAPEVFLRNVGAVSSKSDVYSYGMMVLEMVGMIRKNVDGAAVESTGSEIYFPQWVYDRLDRSDGLGIAGLRVENEEIIARKMIIVGLWCIQMMPANRPSMSMVVDMLRGSTEDLQMPPKP